MLRLEAVNHTRGDRLVLDGASLVVDAGDLVVVHGGRASGKSTLATIAAALLSPEAGAVWIGGRNLVTLQRASLPFVRRNIGYLGPGLPLLEDETALENVMLAAAVRGLSVAASEEAARNALATVTPAGSRGGIDERRPLATLSAGERQLVALARAICGAPPLIVLDDPACGLGTAEDRERVSAALAAERDRGGAVLAISADEALVGALVQRGGRRVRLEAGHLTGGLPPMTVLAGDRDERARGSRQRDLVADGAETGGGEARPDDTWDRQRIGRVGRSSP